MKKRYCLGVENEVDYFAISFCSKCKRYEKSKKFLNGYKGKLIAKIENLMLLKILMKL